MEKVRFLLFKKVREDLLIAYIIKDLVDYLIEDEGMDMQTALSFCIILQLTQR